MPPRPVSAAAVCALPSIAEGESAAPTPCASPRPRRTLPRQVSALTIALRTSALGALPLPPRPASARGLGSVTSGSCSALSPLGSARSGVVNASAQRTAAQLPQPSACAPAVTQHVVWPGCAALTPDLKAALECVQMPRRQAPAGSSAAFAAPAAAQGVRCHEGASVSCRSPPRHRPAAPDHLSDGGNNALLGRGTGVSALPVHILRGD
jgi:hypothetical protein